MNRSLTLSLLLVPLLAGCTTPTSTPQSADDIARALGGRDRIAAIKTMTMEGGGRAKNLGQDMTWEATGQSFVLTDVKRTFDLGGERMRSEQTRTPDFLYFQGPQPQRQIAGVDGDIAYAIAGNGTATRQAAAVARDRRAEYYHHPLTIVRAVLNGALIENTRVGADGRAADVRVGDSTFVLRLDAANLPTSVSSSAYHPNLGDVTVETAFADYQPAGGLTLPRRLTTRIDRHTTLELQIDNYALNSGAGDTAAPATAASAAPTAPAAPRVDVLPVAKGIWLLAGQSHHSAVVEFADHLTLIEAPQSEARTLAAIAKARELVPGKPLTELVMSHHHFDHSAGLRAAVSEGLAVITHRGNAAFVEEMIKRPHTRQPDALTRSPRALTVRSVGAELTLQDKTMTMVVYPLPGNPHSDTMLMAYVPGERVLIEVDAYSPGGTYHPYAANLLQNIRERQLRIDRIVPLHGGIGTFDDLGKAVAAQAVK